LVDCRWLFADGQQRRMVLARLHRSGNPFRIPNPPTLVSILQSAILQISNLPSEWSKPQCVMP
jgi:hypothetical protein